ncbi:hypothetical protein PTI98_010183 [Pleurotus ostreatus]|nr:hypothetical protein PTI98_010183 [Pleurotus ostreatus]
MSGPLTDSFGAMLVGALITMMMYGITNLQTYFYYYAYPKDPLRLKLLVTALWVLDTLHVILMGHALYYYLIKSYGIPSQLEEGTSTLFTSVAVNVLMAFVVQWFFSVRIFQLRTGKITLCLAIATAFFVFAHFCFGIEMVILSFVKKRFDRLSELNYIAALPFAVAAILSDVLVAASLCYLLGSTKTDFDDTRNILNKLIIWSINRCVLTSAVAIIETIVFVAVPHSLYYFAFDFIIGKLYVNSLLAAFNSRKSLHGSAVDTSDFSTAADGSIGFRVATAISAENQNHINLRVRVPGEPERRGSPYLDEEAAESSLVRLS